MMPTVQLDAYRYLHENVLQPNSATAGMPTRLQLTANWKRQKQA